MSRNFRSNYLRSLSITPLDNDNRDRELIESVLSANVIDLEYLRSLSTKLGIPKSFRADIYSIMVGLLPKYTKSWEFIRNVRFERFKDMKRCVILLDVIEKR